MMQHLRVAMKRPKAAEAPSIVDAWFSTIPQWIIYIVLIALVLLLVFLLAKAGDIPWRTGS